MNDSYLMLPSSARRVSTATEDAAVAVTTEPSKWPGVTALRALLDRDKDDDTPDLTVLLCEAYVAVYMSLLVSGLSTCDSSLLYRLISQQPSRAAWAAMFGGGTKRQMRVETLAPASPLIKDSSGGGGEASNDNLLSSSLNTVTNMTKQRIKLNMKLLNVQLGSSPSAQDNSSMMTDNSFSSNSGTAAERRLAYRKCSGSLRAR
jgi:DmX-like protein